MNRASGQRAGFNVLKNHTARPYIFRALDRQKFVSGSALHLSKLRGPVAYVVSCGHTDIGGQPCLTRKDLEGILGTRTRVAEVLNRRRGLSINMIRRLHDKLGIS